MDIRIRHRDGVAFEAETRGHRILCDQPLSDGGADTGLTPPELLLASLGTCAAFYAAQYLKKFKLPGDGLEVRVSAEKAPAPARLGMFRVEVTAPGLPAEHEPGMLRSVNACLIKNTLLNAPSIETVLQRTEAAHA